MRLYKLFLFLIPVLLVSACDGEHHDDTYGHYDVTYIDWVDSANGTIVVDATNDAFEFEAHTGYLHFGNTTYTNVWVNHFGDFFVDGVLVGAVYYVKSIDNLTITALVSNDGFYIDIYGPESNLAWSETTITPIFAAQGISSASLASTQTASVFAAKQMTKPQQQKGSAPLNIMNAISENLPKGTQGTLRQ